MRALTKTEIKEVGGGFIDTFSCIVILPTPKPGTDNTRPGTRKTRKRFLPGRPPRPAEERINLA